MAASTLPKPDAIAALLSCLVGRKVSARAGARLAPDGARSLATYVDADGAVLFAALTDLPFLAGFGAALALIPSSVVDEAVRSGKPSEVLVENAQEVLNVAASLFNDVAYATHVKLRALTVGGAMADVRATVAKAAARLDLDVDLAGYPRGRLTFVAIAREV